MQYALRRVLGEHVQQRGSLVSPERLRFDFSHLSSLTAQQIKEIQEIVNYEVRANHPVYDRQMPIKKRWLPAPLPCLTKSTAATVRVLSVGRPPISVELCGGTHVSATGQIGLFQIVTEASIGAGLRRIEAVTGRAASQAAEKDIPLFSPRPGCWKQHLKV